MFCPNCFNDKDFELRQEIETIIVRDEPIETCSTITYCKSCGDKVWNNEIDNYNLIKAYEIYKKNHSLLTSNEIKQIREQYGISQVTFSKILGLGEKTITRYENGCIQDNAQNNLILLAKNKYNFNVLFKRSKKLLTEAEINKIESNLNNSLPQIVYSDKSINGGINYERQRKQQYGIYRLQPAI